jgi:hypothetical protein
MAKGIRKGSELKNISETWDQNERNRKSGNVPGTERNASNDDMGENDLDRVVKEEAAEYDHTDKEDRILGGDRASINDDPDRNAPGE